MCCGGRLISINFPSLIISSTFLYGCILLKSNSSGLFLFLLVSVGIHMLALWAWQSRQQNDISASQPASLLLALNPAKVTKTETRRPSPARKLPDTIKKTAPHKKNRQAILTRENMIVPAHKTVPATTADTQQQDKPEQATKQDNISQLAIVGTQNKQLLSERIQKRLNLKIGFSRRYPRIAIRNAWEGQVNLGIRVTSNGQLTDVRVINSSGYRVLDNAAVNSVSRVASLPEARPWLNGQSIDVILPIIYKLTDS